jgi:hypothetical protein
VNDEQLFRERLKEAAATAICREGSRVDVEAALSIVRHGRNLSRLVAQGRNGRGPEQLVRIEAASRWLEDICYRVLPKRMW